MALDTEKLLEQASQAVQEAGQLFARRDMAGHIRQKGATDFVTQVDLEVQAMLQKPGCAVSGGRGREGGH